MFAEQKKDFYSVNADIAIEANQQQRNFEYNQRVGMIQDEYASMGVTGAPRSQFDESQQPGAYGPDGTMDPNAFAMESQQADLFQQQQMQLMMLDETMNGPQAVRYDEVYYPRTDKRAIRGNQYTYKGNDFLGQTRNETAVEDTVKNAIGNQEIGKSPIEYTNQLSRAKIFDMKGIRVADQVRSYSNLYHDSIPLSSQHEIQRYGKRAHGLEASKRVNKATFMNQIAQLQQSSQYRPVEEIPTQQRTGDDESAATEVANGGDANRVSDSEWNAVIEALWDQFDSDQSGFLDKDEMLPLAQQALREIGYTEEIDQETCDQFFSDIDKDGNGKVDKGELLKFIQKFI